jgi:hypothetical protein
VSTTTETNSATSPPIGTIEGFWAHLYRLAANAWHAIVAADTEVKEITAEHPEIIAAAKALEAMAPAEVVAGINVAEQVAVAANNIIDHVEAATPAPLSGGTAFVPVSGVVKAVALFGMLGLGLSLSACNTGLTTAQTSSLTSAAVTLATAAAANNTTAATLVHDGQAICGKVSSVPGQLLTDGLIALANAAGAPVSVTGAASSDVKNGCAAVNLVPGPLPAGVNPATVPVQTVATALPATS